MTQSVEHQLVAKLVAHWHLSVSERKALPSDGVAGSLVVAAVQELVSREGWYPPKWRPDQPFDGGLIERAVSGSYRVYWKAEASVGRFELMETQTYGKLAEVGLIYSKRFFGNSIDGIPIAWER